MKSPMRNLGLAGRITVTTAGFSLPLIVAVVYFVLTGNNKDIKFAQWEQYGNAYQRPLEGLLHSLSDHERLVHSYLKGHKEVRGEIDAVRAKLDQGFDNLRAVDTAHGVDLQFTTDGLAKRNRQQFRFDLVLGDWQGLASGWEQLSPEASRSRHRHLIEAVRTMIAHSGDTSNLILDPDLDSYYAMDVTLLALPQTQDRLGVILAEGRDILEKGALTTEDRIQFAVHSSMLKEADIARIKGSLQTAINEDANFYGEFVPLRRLSSSIAAYQSANEALAKLLDQIVAEEKLGVHTDAFTEAGIKARESSFALWDATDDALDGLLQTRIDAITRRRNLALAIAALGTLVAGLIVALYVKRSILSTIRGVSRTLEHNTSSLLESFTEITDAGQALAQGASEQAASIEETSASMEEVSSMTKRNAENSLLSKESSKLARTATESGLGRLQEMSQTLKGIKGAVAEMETAVREMQTSGQEVAKIIRTIDEIAFQTNLLALNAAVEAARAGEAGMGFAVVADEVRALAQRSAQAAKDTSEKIENTVKRSERGAQASERVVQHLADVESTARKLEASFQDIATKISGLDEVMGQITSASQEQSEGIAQVSNAMQQMDQVTQANAANAEQNAASARDLKGQADSLQAVMAELLTLVRGGRSAVGGDGDPYDPNPRRIARTPRPSATHHDPPAMHPAGQRRIAPPPSRKSIPAAGGIPMPADAPPRTPGKAPDDDFQDF